MARRALITGVGRRRGIGAGIATGLAAAGWDLALSFWHPYDERLGLEGSADDPDALAAELRNGGRTVELVPANLEDPAAADALVADSARRLGPLDALVMSHTESVASGVLDTSVLSFDRHYAVNVRATWLLPFSRSQDPPPRAWRVTTGSPRPVRPAPVRRQLLSTRGWEA